MERTGTTQSQLSSITGVSQGRISDLVRGKVGMSDEMLAYLLSPMGYRPTVSVVAEAPDLNRSELRSWLLHRQLCTHLDAETLARWTPTIRANLDRLGDSIRGEPHLSNLVRWTDLVARADLREIRRVLLDVSRDGIEMREVSPFSGLLPQRERLQVIRGLAA